MPVFKALSEFKSRNGDFETEERERHSAEGDPLDNLDDMS